MKLILEWDPTKDLEEDAARLQRRISRLVDNYELRPGINTTKIVQAEEEYRRRSECPRLR